MVEPIQRSGYLLHFGNSYFVSDGISLNDFDCISQVLAAVLDEYIRYHASG